MIGGPGERDATLFHALGELAVGLRPQARTSADNAFASSRQKRSCLAMTTPATGRVVAAPAERATPTTRIGDATSDAT